MSSAVSTIKLLIKVYDTKMKKSIYILFSLLFAVLTLVVSCDDDGDDPKKVKFEVICNTPGVPVYLLRWQIKIKDYWTKELDGDDIEIRYYGYSLEAMCDTDPDALITINLYFDGKLVASEEGNYRVYLHYIRNK